MAARALVEVGRVEQPRMPIPSRRTCGIPYSSAHVPADQRGGVPVERLPLDGPDRLRVAARPDGGGVERLVPAATTADAAACGGGRGCRRVFERLVFVPS
jgi:hypothetical protein